MGFVGSRGDFLGSWFLPPFYHGRHLKSRVPLLGYSPPHSSPDHFTVFKRVIDKIDAENLELYLLGGLNCNLLQDIVDNNFPHLLNIYILLDVLLCSIAEYFYELCRILTSP